MKKKTTQGLGNKNLLSFPKHMSTVICQYNMYRNKIHHLDYFPICQEANESLQKTAQKQLSNSCHRSGLGHV